VSPHAVKSLEKGIFFIYCSEAAINKKYPPPPPPFAQAKRAQKENSVNK